jgi:FKBP-type peptidyl-prolyl cis-trans isomerase
MMNRCLPLALGLVLLLSGCEQKELPPAMSEAEEAAARHEKYFGAAAGAKDIAWRASGLGIRILAPGAGAAPGLADTVRVHYVGRLKDGTVFDSSRARGAPADFAVSRVIAGWAAAMPSLRPGGKAEFFIPPSLGYGNAQSGKIPPNSGLIFEVELIAVNPMAPAER